MTTFLPIRHGRTAVRDRISGWTPGVHLSEEGRREAGGIRESL